MRDKVVGRPNMPSPIKNMKNRLIVFSAQFISNIITIIYLRYTTKGLIPQTLIADSLLCVINFTILKKVIEDHNDKWLWFYYTLGSVIGTFISMKIFELIN